MSWNIFCTGLVHVIIGACFDRLVISFSISCREKLVSLILLGLRVPKWYPQNLMVGTSLFSMDTEIEIVLFLIILGLEISAEKRSSHVLILEHAPCPTRIGSLKLKWWIYPVLQGFWNVGKALLILLMFLSMRFVMDNWALEAKGYSR